MTVPLILASATTCSRAFLESVAAFNFRKAYLVEPAIALAILVFPVPGGPYKIIDDNNLALTIRRMIFPGPTSSCCPTTSSRLRGRIRYAKGRI